MILRNTVLFIDVHTTVTRCPEKPFGQLRLTPEVGRQNFLRQRGTFPNSALSKKPDDCIRFANNRMPLVKILFLRIHT